MASLFDPVQMGDLALPNRIGMAPLTRNRAVVGLKPGDLTVEYYRQRASAGLIIALHQSFSGCWMVKAMTEQTPSRRSPAARPTWSPSAVHSISNPDLVRRLREAAPLTPLQEDKLYGGGAEGYTDYPTLDATG